MNKDQITLEVILPVSSDQLYADWLNSEAHTDFTGGEAKTTEELNASFTAWDGYIFGQNTALIKGKKIVQTWRTTEFNEDEQDSILELLFESIDNNKTKLTLNHSSIPKGDGDKYKIGWTEHYFEPMLAYYNNNK